MFCFQCQETVKNEGCGVRGVCGKTEETANLQDLLIHVLKGIALYAEKAGQKGPLDRRYGRFVAEALFATITNVNFDNDRITALIREALALRDALKEICGADAQDVRHDSAVWFSDDADEFAKKAAEVGILSMEDPDARSLSMLLIYGLKGIAAYAEHAAVLGFEDEKIDRFLMEALASTTRDLSVEDRVALVMRAGECAVDVMALLDKANTTTYGNPEMSRVPIGVRGNPGILISGHDLKDLEELLKQTEGTGVDVYTHGEMLPANSYPAFKTYAHFAGNYGNAWWRQAEEFASFNGPILMTTNCIIPVKEAYRDRIFTTGVVGYPGLKHIPDRPRGGMKDFSEIIALAKTCAPPTEIETGELVTGFGHHQVLALADRVVDAVKSGAIKRFIVMAGCDGRHKTRGYYTDVASALPPDTVILTAGCAKYRYNKLALGDIGGIPRVLDAGQCNDCYSLAVIALKLKEAFGLNDINELPISFDIAWYEQKAVAVLLALLFLGVKGIRLGPTLPAFVSPNVLKVLVENFNIRPITDVGTDVEAMMQGR
ncbi:MAG: hydroxylamine reductase [Syntrophales bacterium]|nr:hydroxylamine reductase [Syntrophales bacterium]HOG08245.1 hydroxylamine reductase [Syntrophales bacterium]HOS76410.1 hydroxylamine reductase [Syntrophales bacterium]HPB70479.1 hydroxylamine reductase [Syntrophales bacterium]HQN26607.1 hydroxylamine reductase [Syntrophales bacterium]